MVDGVTDEVDERLFHDFEQSAIELQFRPLHGPVDQLATIGSQIFDHRRKQAKDGHRRRQAQTAELLFQ